ncbi:MAG: hypothetical protein M0R03_16325 [Novosphingobium sp.]|nr:hypothetical protein [Novosphingobium sp.]
MISAKDVWREIKKPEDIKEEDAILMLIYKAVCMGIRLLLDVRYKLYYGEQALDDKKSSKKIEKVVANPVIKPTDLM